MSTSSEIDELTKLLCKSTPLDRGRGEHKRIHAFLESCDGPDCECWDSMRKATQGFVALIQVNEKAKS